MPPPLAGRECRPISHTGRRMAQRHRDFLILAAVVLAILAVAELFLQLQAWDSTATCLARGQRNCGTAIYLKDLTQTAQPEDAAPPERR